MQQKDGVWVALVTGQAYHQVLVDFQVLASDHVLEAAVLLPAQFFTCSNECRVTHTDTSHGHFTRTRHTDTSHGHFTRTLHTHSGSHSGAAIRGGGGGGGGSMW